MYDLMFVLAHVSLVLILCFLFVMLRTKNKSDLTKVFIFFLIDLFVWTFGAIGVRYSYNLGFEDNVMFFENLTYFGVAFIAVSIMLMGKSFGSESSYKLKRIFPVFIIPVLTQIMVWTNPIHHFFYVDFGANYGFEAVKFGWYFYIHGIYSYICILLGVFFMLRFALKNKGNSSFQALILFVGTLIPIVVNVCFTLGIGNFNSISTPVAFMITSLTFLYGMYRFNLFRVTPIALSTIVNKISDLYIVLDENMNIVDYNEPFYKVFSPVLYLKENGNLREFLGKMNKTGVSAEILVREIDKCRETRELHVQDLEMNIAGEVKYYSVEFTPLLVEDTYRGCIVLLRDITRAINDMKEIEKNHKILIEKERLASLGQLIGGIAHNLKTPIMAISGRTESLADLIDEYENSLTDKDVTLEDHKEIAGEMREQIEKMQTHMSYISEIISAVKDQTMQYASMAFELFTVGDLIKRIKILMHHELVRFNCELITDIRVDEELEVPGDINALVQVIDNIIVNAIHAYKGESGQIVLTILQTQNNMIEISIADKAGGIDKEIQEHLFKQMTTTKGKDGTGLGLYISHSTIVGKFGGKLWFESIEGQETEFFITLPLNKNNVGGAI